MARGVWFLSLLAHVIGIVAFALLLACMINTHWSEFTAAQIERAGYLSPWKICQQLPKGEHCVSSELLSNKLSMSSILGNTAIVFHTFFVGSGLMEIVLLTRHLTFSSLFRACSLAKVIFAVGATITSLSSVYLFTSGLEALVTLTHQHSPPYYVWWFIVLLSVCGFGVSCVQAWLVFRRFKQRRLARSAATLTVEEIPLQTFTTRTVANNWPTRHAIPRRSALAGSRMKSMQSTPARVHKARKMVVRFAPIPEETGSHSSSD
uniref:Uncharacterized protein n=1 Tax=Anopheles albimanus TaxID=7167 RepID=A0A182FJR5_ANOAL